MEGYSLKVERVESRKRLSAHSERVDMVVVNTQKRILDVLTTSTTIDLRDDINSQKVRRIDIVQCWRIGMTNEALVLLLHCVN